VSGTVLGPSNIVIVPPAGGTPPTISTYAVGTSTDPSAVAVSATTASTVDGSYSLVLPVGTYDIVFSYTGLADVTVTPVTVTVGATTTVNATL